jgi:insulysin
MEVPQTHSDRTYHAVTLPNGLRCCLISDPSVEKGAVAVTVAAGQLQDSLPGIAHLTEHLLFMGSKTYPSENEYDQFVQKHGGHSNAYTDNEATCFYLDVLAGQLESAMDQLACALSEPLLAVTSIERELLAVDSEHAKNVSNDLWRQLQLVGTILGQEGKHPYSNFGTGNKESLLKEAGNDSPYEKLRSEVEQFYRDHYVASNMTLAAMNACPIDELQAMVERIFAKLPSGPSKTVYSPPLPEFRQWWSGSLYVKIAPYWMFNGFCPLPSGRNISPSQHASGPTLLDMKAQELCSLCFERSIGYKI